MRIVVGIDPRSPCESLTNLVGRLGLSGATAHCLSFAPLPLAVADGPLGSRQELSGVVAAQRADAERATAHACGELGKFGLTCHTSFEPGEASRKLAVAAQALRADVLAIGSRRRGALKSLVLGSVGRALTLDCPCSLVIAKGRVASTGGIKALFAHDGSDFCDRCLDELIRLSPRGLREIDVVSVDPKDVLWRREGLMQRAEAAACRLRRASFAADAYLMTGDVVRTLEHTAVDHGADLVVVGAKGHGFIDRALFGSVALEQAVSAPHSVLILRPPTWP